MGFDMIGPFLGLLEKQEQEMRHALGAVDKQWLMQNPLNSQQSLPS